MDFKEAIAGILEGIGVEDASLDIPPDSEMGDYSFPCFVLAKKEKKSPAQIAAELAKKIDLGKHSHVIEKVEAKGPYLNFFTNKGRLVEEVLKDVKSKKENYGSSNIGKGKTALIEHTSINPNASPHVGRARNALIGDSIVRLFRFQGCKTDVHYFVNDVGKQIAMLVLGCKDRKNVTFSDLLSIYVQFNEQLKEKPELEKDVFEVLHKLESGDKDVKELFRKIVKICIDGQSEILAELGIKYDSYDYESKYLWDKRTSEILKMLEETGELFVDDEDRKVLNQDRYNLPMKAAVLVLTRADGTTLYPLRDLAYTIEKIEKKADRNIIVLGEDQKLYFKQINAAMDLLKYKAPEEVHYSFVLLKEGKMSTRKGNVVLLEDFMKEARDRAVIEVEKREKSKDVDKTAKIIGYGALKFAILKISPDKNVMFDWDSALSFEGETGPYVQYSHARACSMIRKYGKTISADADFSLLKDNAEVELVKQVSRLGDVVDDATNNLRPHVIAIYAYELAKRFSEFYHACPCITDDEELSKARMLLVESAKTALKTSLNLLGIDAPEEM